MADTPQVPGWDLIPVRATWWSTDQQTMRTGTYVVSLPRVTNVAASPKVIIPAGTWAQGALATTPGSPSMSVSVPASDDPAVRESGWQVQIVVTMGTVVESYSIDVLTASAGAGIDLRDYTPTTSTLPALVSAVGLGTPSGLALISADGTQVVDKDGTVLSGGGGGGGGDVLSVAGRTGNVVLATTDLTDSTATGRSVLTAASAAAARTAIGAGTSSLALGTTGSTALAGDTPVVPPTRTVNGQPLSADVTLTSSSVGLGLVANIAPMDLPVSTATSSALTAGLAGKSNTGHTHVKADVGLGNVDNTTDAAKPVSSATQAALDAKSPVGHVHTAGNITDASVVGVGILTAADAPAVRTLIGAGTSNLTLGSTGSTALAGTWRPATTDITGATASGQATMAAPALPILPVTQASNGSWPARPSWAGLIMWLGYPGLTTPPSGASTDDLYLARPVP